MQTLERDRERERSVKCKLPTQSVLVITLNRLLSVSGLAGT